MNAHYTRELNINQKTAINKSFYRKRTHLLRFACSQWQRYINHIRNELRKLFICNYKTVRQRWVCQNHYVFGLSLCVYVFLSLNQCETSWQPECSFNFWSDTWPLPVEVKTNSSPSSVVLYWVIISPILSHFGVKPDPIRFHIKTVRCTVSKIQQQIKWYLWTTLNNFWCRIW